MDIQSLRYRYAVILDEINKLISGKYYCISRRCLSRIYAMGISPRLDVLLPLAQRCRGPCHIRMGLNISIVPSIPIDIYFNNTICALSVDTSTPTNSSGVALYLRAVLRQLRELFYSKNAAYMTQSNWKRVIDELSETRKYETMPVGYNHTHIETQDALLVFCILEKSHM